MGDQQTPQTARNLTQSTLLQGISYYCPGLFPQVESNSTFIDVQISQEGILTVLAIYGDWEVNRFAESSVPQIQALLSCYKLRKNSVIQIWLKMSTVEFSILTESSYKGVVDGLSKGYIIVKIGKMKVAVRTRLDLAVTDPCIVVRDHYLHLAEESYESPVTSQPSPQISYPGSDYQQVYEPALESYSLQPSGAQYGADVPGTQQMDTAFSAGYIQPPMYTQQVQPSQHFAFSQGGYPPNMPAEQAPQYPPATFYPGPVSPELGLDQSLDVSDIDVETYPKTSGERRLPIRSLANCSKWNQDMIAYALSLANKYTHWRRSRGDGNCYYRAVAIGYLEHLCRLSTPPQEFFQFYVGLFEQRTVLLHANLLPYFHSFIAKLKELYGYKKTGQALPMLETMFQDSNFDLGAVATFRMLARRTLYDLREHEDIFPFVIDGVDPILEQIARMGEEAEGVTFSVMANALDAKIVHVTLDSKVCREDAFEPFTPGRKVVLHILLKPGHYDALYPISAQRLDHYSYSTGELHEEQGPVGLMEGLFEEVRSRG